MRATVVPTPEPEDPTYVFVYCASAAVVCVALIAVALVQKYWVEIVLHFAHRYLKGDLSIAAMSALEAGLAIHKGGYYYLSEADANAVHSFVETATQQILHPALRHPEMPFFDSNKPSIFRARAASRLTREDAQAQTEKVLKTIHDLKPTKQLPAGGPRTLPIVERAPDGKGLLVPYLQLEEFRGVGMTMLLRAFDDEPAAGAAADGEHAKLSFLVHKYVRLVQTTIGLSMLSATVTPVSGPRLFSPLYIAMGDTAIKVLTGGAAAPQPGTLAFDEGYFSGRDARPAGRRELNVLRLVDLFSKEAHNIQQFVQDLVSALVLYIRDPPLAVAMRDPDAPVSISAEDYTHVLQTLATEVARELFRDQEVWDSVAGYLRLAVLVFSSDEVRAHLPWARQTSVFLRNFV
ncbi:uncharacterized protein V1510DRAFT_412193 [Dipodascopsis tothii]|uniref:uncharacterized protein n=1 Tax=Dipodascopsis tothii TaxID=44089 RepID=UPI0034CFE5A9